MTFSKPLSLYIHWPFCLSKCPYCDFNSHVRDTIDEKLWETTLLAELKATAKLTPSHHLVSIFFGGGTPSLMPAALAERLIEMARTLWDVPSGKNLEITLEANPNAVDVEKFKAFRDAGINRISLGIQSLSEDELRFLGRSHGRAEALRALEVTQTYFDRYSFDLIYALPGQSCKHWAESLKSALPWAKGHISLYQLTIEPGTAFKTRYDRGDFTLPSPEDAGRLYDICDEILGEQGYQAYEVSNYAQPGQECRHNLTYWRYEDYAGIGPGAHGRLTLQGKKSITRGYKSPEKWLHEVQKQGNGFQEITPLITEECAKEALMMGLRLREGLNLKRFKQETGISITETFENETLSPLIAEGLLTVSSEKLMATSRGRQKLNSLLVYLFDRLTFTPSSEKKEK